MTNIKICVVGVAVWGVVWRSWWISVIHVDTVNMVIVCVLLMRRGVRIMTDVRWGGGWGYFDFWGWSWLEWRRRSGRPGFARRWVSRIRGSDRSPVRIDASIRWAIESRIQGCSAHVGYTRWRGSESVISCKTISQINPWFPFHSDDDPVQKNPDFHVCVLGGEDGRQEVLVHPSGGENGLPSWVRRKKKNNNDR